MCMLKIGSLREETVQLGTGDVNFAQFFSALNKIEYSNDLIIQGARFNEDKITPEQTCKTYQKFVKEYVDNFYT